MSGLLKVKTRVKLKPDFIAKLCNKKWRVVPPPSLLPNARTLLKIVIKNNAPRLVDLIIFGRSRGENLSFEMQADP